MRFADILKMCFDSLSRRKGRTILTVLGVFIGCTSIIVMVSIGAGMQESYDQMLKNMGDLSIIEVYRGYNQSTGTQTESKLDDKAVESFHEIAGVKAVMPKASLDGYNVGFKAGINGRYTANWVDFAGIDSSALEDMGFELMDGRYPESSDEVVVGQYFAYNFFDTLMPDGRNYVDRYIWDENGNIDTEKVPDPFFDPLKTSITMVLTPYDDGTGTEPTPYEVELKVVGVMKEDRGKGYETSDGVMMDINALKALIQDLTGKTDTKFEYSSINVKAESLDAVSDVEQSIKDLGYSTYSMQSMRDELNKQTRQIELMLGGLGAISLLVAAIGITNTMIMSISERTKDNFSSLGSPHLRQLAALEGGKGAVQRQCQQRTQGYVNAAVLLEQHGGADDGNAQHGGCGTHPAAAGRIKNAAAVVRQQQRYRVEHMNGRADVGGGVGTVQKAHSLRKDIAARHPVGAQVQRRGQHRVARQCNGHAGEQRQA